MRKYIIIYVLIVLGCISCDSFLEPSSQTEFVPENATSLNEMLLGEAYPRSTDGKAVFALLPMFDDDITCTDFVGGTGLNDASKFTAYQALYSWQPDMFVTMDNVGLYTNNNTWKGLYIRIRGANTALDYIDDVDGTYDEKAIVKAQAYALRAFYYFHLVNLWGEPYNYNKKALGVPLKTTSAMEVKELPRNTVEEVYDLIMSDLNESERLYESLPEEMRYKRDYRTSLPMVQLLKSRVLLYMENWKEAAVYANKVIKDWNFSLLDLNSLKAPTAKEPYYNFVSMDCPENIWCYGSTDDFLTYMTIYVQSQSTDSEKTQARKKFNASKELLNGYLAGDLRKERYIVKEYEDQSRYLPYGKMGISSTHVPINGTYFGLSFRLSEAYLNLAEAAAKDDDETTALWALNELRRNRFADYDDIQSVTGEELVTLIRQERRLELCFEGHRWFDLRRYGMPSFSREWWDNGKFVKRYTLEENDPSYTLPIPQAVMDLNKKLVQNKLANPR